MKVLLLSALMLLPSMALSGLKEIPTVYRITSEINNIPADIVYAIALTESGYTWQSTFNPWPWSLNIGGQAHRFNSRVEAYQALKAAVKKDQSVDIGIMQVNWYWHKNRFTGLWSALDPYINLKVGIEILIENYQSSKKWWLAVGHYHAPGQSKKAKKRAALYRQRVNRQWQTIQKYKVNRLVMNTKGDTL